MRRANPENIHEAKRAGDRGLMVSSWHVDETSADRLMDEWDAEATARGLERADSAYWSEAEPWLRDKCRVSDGA